MRQSLNFFSCELLDGVSCVPVCFGFIDSYMDYENTLNIKKVPVLLQKQP